MSYPAEIVAYCIHLSHSKKSFAFKYQVEKDGMTNILKNTTSFLNVNSPISHRVWCILNDIHQIPLCYCGLPLKFGRFLTGFLNFCSIKCSSNSITKKEKIKATNLKKYGCGNAFQTNAGRIAWNTYINDALRVARMKTKSGETLKLHLGVDTIEEAHKLRAENALKLKIEKYGFNFNNRVKAKLTRDEPQIQYKMRETSLRKYGVSHPMQTSEIFDNCMKRQYSRKEYILPSGNIVNIQGYEHLALDDLLKIHDECDIVLGAKNMPEIWYTYEQKLHRYYPDMFVKPTNMVIEVKSEYTMRISKHINALKADATKKAGYNFEFYVYDKSKKRMIV